MAEGGTQFMLNTINEKESVKMLETVKERILETLKTSPVIVFMKRLDDDFVYKMRSAVTTTKVVLARDPAILQ